MFTLVPVDVITPLHVAAYDCMSINKIGDVCVNVCASMSTYTSASDVCMCERVRTFVNIGSASNVRISTVPVVYVCVNVCAIICVNTGSARDGVTTSAPQ